MPRNSGLPLAAEISRVRDRDATVVVPMLFLPLLSEPSGYYPALGGVCRGSFAQDRSKKSAKALLGTPPLAPAKSCVCDMRRIGSGEATAGKPRMFGQRGVLAVACRLQPIGRDLASEPSQPHHPLSSGGKLSANANAVLPIVHLLFSNVKIWLNGTFHGVSAKHLPRYAREWNYRFNRRRRIANLTDFLLRRAATRPTITYSQLVHGAQINGALPALTG